MKVFINLTIINLELVLDFKWFIFVFLRVVMLLSMTFSLAWRASVENTISLINTNVVLMSSSVESTSKQNVWLFSWWLDANNVCIFLALTKAVVSAAGFFSWLGSSQPVRAEKAVWALVYCWWPARATRSSRCYQASAPFNLAWY